MWTKIKHFTPDEFQCKCGCKICNVNQDFLEALDNAREYSQIPFAITSGCRCVSWNSGVGGKKNSLHIATENKQCAAADIQASSDQARYLIVSALVLAGFTHIGINVKKKFVHVDYSDRRGLWIYEKGS